MANHADGKVLFNDCFVRVKRGQLLTTMKKLGDTCGWSLKKVSNFLNKLQKDDMIKQKRTSKYTLLTIVNYDFYQSKKAERKNKGKSEENQRKTNKNDKEGIKNPLMEI
jgi:DNA replication protein DnaD